MIKWLLVFLVISSSAFSQQIVEGTVIDKETGKPIPFASIGVVGTSRGTSSNLNGQFSLVVSDSNSIKVSCVGYESRVINSIEDIHLIELKPVATILNAVYIYNKAINPKKIVRKAFSSIDNNYDDRSFLQKFFYRHYSKDDSEYERLIEASVDVWKHGGYSSIRRSAGDKEEMRIRQLRRSLDIKGMVQAQKPISLGYALQTDIVGYQTAVSSEHLKLFEEASNLKTDFEKYTFTFDGITNYDGQEVYKIGYAFKKDSILTTTGYEEAPQASGSLYITTDSYAFVKTEEVKSDEVNTIRTTAYYRKYNNKYYPYHFIREGENRFAKKVHSFHIELMSAEIRHGVEEQFTGREPGRDELLTIAYDSSFWKNCTILKTTPLEDDIISDLGGGRSLNKQFYLYKQYELNVTEGGKNGEEKFNWLKADSKGKRILYLCFWKSQFNSFSEIIELENIKRLNQLYKNKITFVFLSLENDETIWKQLLTKHNLFADGIINYRIGENSEIAKSFKIKNVPTFILLSSDGSVFDAATKNPSDPLLKKDFQILIEQVNQP